MTKKIEELHFVCLSCGKIFKYPQIKRDCDNCRSKYKKGKRYTKCILCTNQVIDSRYPLCPEHYYANKSLDAKMYQQSLRGHYYD